MLFLPATGWLLLGNDGRVDIEVMAYEGGVDLRGVAGIPCKYVNIPFKKLNQLLFLLKRQPSPYSEELLRVVINDLRISPPQQLR